MEGGGAGFSLESTLDMGFIIYSRLFTGDELATLEPVNLGSDE